MNVAELFTKLKNSNNDDEIQSLSKMITRKLHNESRFVQPVVSSMISGAVVSCQKDSLNEMFESDLYFKFYYTVLTGRNNISTLSISVSCVQSHMYQDETVDYELLRAIEREVKDRNMSDIVSSISVNELLLRDGKIYSF